MKTSFTRLIETEKFLQGEMPPEDAVVFKARLLIEKELKANTIFHGLVHRLVLIYSRKNKKAEMDALHVRLFNDPRKSAFRDDILRIFNS